MTKILDRYVISSMLLSFCICMMTIMCFFIVVDLFENFHRFSTYVERTNEAAQETGKQQQSLISIIVSHYMYLSPMILYYFTPLITVIATVFTLLRMMRSRELVILQTTSLSNYRIALPFVVFAILIAGGMVYTQEYLLPAIGDEIISTNKIRKGRRVRSASQYKDNKQRVFYIAIINPLTQKIYDVRVTQFQKENYIPEKVIEAKIGQWENDTLVLYKGTIVNYETNEESIITKDGYKLDTDLTLYKLLTPDKNLDVLRYAQLRDLYKSYRNPGALVTMYNRWTTPISIIFLVLLTVAVILHSAIENFPQKIIVCIILTLIFYCINFLCLGMGKKELLTPLFAASFPIILLGSAGVATIITAN
ncbi:LptF/LptG family permease [Candidatus Uabimicrobium amorphum]|uniref:LPS export ABC transporter permease LptG n=1 Tax=Uabimicrobium amorphum TaxID=2596890 RepID=A0A5S9F5Z6_UABAM|nr:LptF/LptG family permease [Candidatus Uabimicrobium amorphum]BBM86109.1 LPS export ABC transporter permease LptG [Candidatus Uabimicrobium amorphum]